VEIELLESSAGLLILVLPDTHASNVLLLPESPHSHVVQGRGCPLMDAILSLIANNNVRCMVTSTSHSTRVRPETANRASPFWVSSVVDTAYIASRFAFLLLTTERQDMEEQSSRCSTYMSTWENSRIDRYRHGSTDDRQFDSTKAHH
jgi:hypothetical protein